MRQEPGNIGKYGDDIDRLFELLADQEPAPGPAFEEALQALRPRSNPIVLPVRATRRSWRLRLAALPMVAALVLTCLIAAAFLVIQSPDQNDVRQNTQSGLPAVAPGSATETVNALLASSQPGTLPAPVAASTPLGPISNVAGTDDSILTRINKTDDLQIPFTRQSSYIPW